MSVYYFIISSTYRTKYIVNVAVYKFSFYNRNTKLSDFIAYKRCNNSYFRFKRQKLFDLTQGNLSTAYNKNFLVFYIYIERKISHYSTPPKVLYTFRIFSNSSADNSSLSLYKSSSKDFSLSFIFTASIYGKKL